MPCLAVTSRLHGACRVSGDIPVSKELSANSFTLPIFPGISFNAIDTICSVISEAHGQAAQILATKVSPEAPLVVPVPPANSASNMRNIASKYRQCKVLKMVYPERDFVTSGTPTSPPATILVPFTDLDGSGISLDQIHRRFVEKRQWKVGNKVFDDTEVICDLVVMATYASLVVIGSSSESKSQALDESGSSAHVGLYIEPNNKLIVRKTCLGDGIDGNGRPWLRRQCKFLTTSVAVKKTDMFVKPLDFDNTREENGAVSISFPYIDSHSIGELVFAGMGSRPLLSVLRELLGEMSTSVWTEGLENAPRDFIQQAHISRMERRVEIARRHVPVLNATANEEIVMLNGRKLRRFKLVLAALKDYPKVLSMQPRKLSEIHGDLNIHNILCQLDPNKNRAVVLIDPRGVPLLDDSINNSKAFEAGDYAYDLSKLLFSVSGFSEIRKGYYELHHSDNSFQLSIKHNQGTETMVGASRGFFDALESDDRFKEWAKRVEPSGLESMRLRTLLGEAAHFVADSACALGRDKKEEVLPLFLIGLEKLNNVLDLLNGDVNELVPSTALQVEAPDESPDVGANMIRKTLLGALSKKKADWPWDIMEFLVKDESTNTLRHLLKDMVGEYFPEGMAIHVSSHPQARPVSFPCVVIHAFDGVRGQLGAVIAGARRTTEFLTDSGYSSEMIDKLRIVTVGSTGASTRSQFVARANDKLLSSGTWGLSPLSLTALQSLQLSFPSRTGGRWVVENDSLFLLNRPLKFAGKGLTLLTATRPTSTANSADRWCISDIEVVGGHTFAKNFSSIRSDQQTLQLRHTSAVFVPHGVTDALANHEADYAVRMSSLFLDLVFPRFMDKKSWITLSHKQGYSVNADLAWKVAHKLQDKFPLVELAHGGDDMRFHHYGTDDDYNKMLQDAPKDTMLNAMAYMTSMVKWVSRRAGGVSGGDVV